MKYSTLVIDSTYLDVLRKICTCLDGTNINWVVTGSLGMALQGIHISPNDIDIQTDEAGAYEITRRFAEFVVKEVMFSAAEKICSHFGALMIDGVKVEIMGGIQKRLADGTWEEPVDLEHHKRFVAIEGMQVPVLSLEYEYQAYMKLGRFEKAHMLKQALNAPEKAS